MNEASPAAATSCGKELAVFARELEGREDNLSIQPRLPTAEKRTGLVNINFMVH